MRLVDCLAGVWASTRMPRDTSLARLHAALARADHFLYGAVLPRAQRLAPVWVSGRRVHMPLLWLHTAALAGGDQYPYNAVPPQAYHLRLCRRPR